MKRRYSSRRKMKSGTINGFGMSWTQRPAISLPAKSLRNRYVKDARKAINAAKNMTNVRPDAIVTDGLPAYNTAIKAEFYDPHAFIQNPHVRLKDFETKPNNNILERLNGTFRERTKVVRTFDSGLGAAGVCSRYADVLQLHPATSGNRRDGAGTARKYPD